MDSGQAIRTTLEVGPRWWGESCPHCDRPLGRVPDLFEVVPPGWELRCSDCDLVLLVKGEADW